MYNSAVKAVLGGVLFKPKYVFTLCRCYNVSYLFRSYLKCSSWFNNCNDDELKGCFVHVECKLFANCGYCYGNANSTGHSAFAFPINIMSLILRAPKTSHCTVLSYMHV